jgi:hypothetical protein
MSNFFFFHDNFGLSSQNKLREHSFTSKEIKKAFAFEDNHRLDHKEHVYQAFFCFSILFISSILVYFFLSFLWFSFC